MIDTRDIEGLKPRCREYFTEFWTKVAEWYNRLHLWPERSILVHALVAAAAWCVLSVSLWAIASALLDRGFADNYRYFYSAAAQSVAAVGALVLVASFTVLQMGGGSAARRVVVYDRRLQEAVAVVWTAIVVPLSLIYLVPPASGPVPLTKWHGAQYCSSWALLVVCLWLVIRYALGVPAYLDELAIRRHLLSLLQKAQRAGAPCAQGMLRTALDTCKDAVLSHLSPAQRDNFDQAVNDLEIASQCGFRAGKLEAVADTWEAVAIGAAASEGGGLGKLRTGSWWIMFRVWQMIGQSCLDDNTDGVLRLSAVTLACARQRRAMGDAKWADRFWDTFSDWVGGIPTLTQDSGRTGAIIHTKLPLLFDAAFPLLVAEYATKGAPALDRVHKAWGPGSHAARILNEHARTAGSGDGNPPTHVDRLQTLAHPVAAALVIGGLALRRKADDVESLIHRTTRLPNIKELLDDAVLLDEPLDRYSTIADIESLPQDYSEVLPPPSMVLVYKEFTEFALYVRCAIELGLPEAGSFKGLRWSHMSESWFLALHPQDIDGLSRRLAVMKLFKDAHPKLLLQKLATRLSEVKPVQ